MSETLLYYHTLRHLSKGQILARARKLCLPRRPLLPRRKSAPQWDNARLRKLRRYLSADPATPDAAAKALREGLFEMAGETVEASPNALPWHEAAASPLWRVHLHGFFFLRQMARCYLQQGHEPDRELALRWMHDWIARNPVGCLPAWDSYAVAARLMHWPLACAAFDIADDAVLASYGLQADFLARRIEHDLRANHLINNAAGLIVAGALMGTPHREQGLALLERELAEQVRPDGGHYERSFLYHSRVMEDCLLAREALDTPPEWLDATLKKMAAFLARYQHTDGGIPLFGDAALDEAAPPRVLLARVAAIEAPQPELTPNASGYYLLEAAREEVRMLVRAGAPGPAYQLGHAHCDMLSYELTIDEQRIIVDSGTHGYAGSPWRDYCRGTRAHNTVMVNGQEQLEYWGTFRVGRRYAPLPAALSRGPIGLRFSGGYRAWQGYRHEREITCEPKGAWWIQDAVEADGAIDAESFIHLHPHCTVQREGQVWRVQMGRIALSIRPYGCEDAELVRGAKAPLQGWYCPRFGQALPAPVLVLHAAGRSKLRFGYAIVPGSA